MGLLGVSMENQTRGSNETIFILLFAFSLLVIHHSDWKQWGNAKGWEGKTLKTGQSANLYLYLFIACAMSCQCQAETDTYGELMMMLLITMCFYWRPVREGSYPACQSQGDVTLLSRVCDLQLVVVAACAEGPASLGQAHIHDALPLPHVLQQLTGRDNQK